MFFFFYSSLVSLWKESFDGRKCIPKSTSHGSFGVNTMYSRHSYTPSLSRSPQHFHRPGERRAKNLRFFYFSELCPVSPTPVPFDLLSVDHEQDWCSLLLYPLKTKTPVPLPLSVTLSSLTNKVREATVPQPFVLYFFFPHFFVNKLCTLNVLMVALLSSLNGLNIQYNWLLKYSRHYSF